MRTRSWLSVGLAVMGLAMVAGAHAPAASKAAPATEAKLDQTLDTTFTKAGDKISATLQAATSVNGTTLPKGSKITGTVGRAVKQDKTHKNSGLVLVFDTAVVKGGQAVPVKVVILSLKPSHLDEVEQVEVGSGDVTDASLAADVANGEMNDPNTGMQGAVTSTVNGVKVTSSIKGVVLFASPKGSSSGVAVALKGPLVLDRWTRMDVVLAPRQ